MPGVSWVWVNGDQCHHVRKVVMSTSSLYRLKTLLYIHPLGLHCTMYLFSQRRIAVATTPHTMYFPLILFDQVYANVALNQSNPANVSAILPWTPTAQFPKWFRQCRPTSSIWFELLIYVSTFPKNRWAHELPMCTGSRIFCASVRVKCFFLICLLVRQGLNVFFCVLGGGGGGW